MLIWGGASSVGTFAIQSAKTLGFTVYATASPKHHGCLEKLGADAVFDYNSGDVVSQIVAAAKKDGVKLHTAHCVVNGGLQPSLDVLKETKGDAVAKVAHSPVLPPDHPTLDNTEITFHFPSMDMYGGEGQAYSAVLPRMAASGPEVGFSRSQPEPSGGGRWFRGFKPGAGQVEGGRQWD